jgi:hypothetical protein
MKIVSQTYKLSWVAYLRPIVIFGAFLFLSAIFYGNDFLKVSLFITSFALINLIISVISIHKCVICINNDGVWLYSGIFPWSKGANGVQWQNIDDAHYFPNFVSWVTKSYRIGVSHRFTKDNEFSIKHVKHGNNAVLEINSLLQKIHFEKG